MVQKNGCVCEKKKINRCVLMRANAHLFSFIATNLTVTNHSNSMIAWNFIYDSSFYTHIFYHILDGWVWMIVSNNAFHSILLYIYNTYILLYESVHENFRLKRAHKSRYKSTIKFLWSSQKDSRKHFIGSTFTMIEDVNIKHT